MATIAFLAPNAVDVVALAVLAWGTVMGFRRGLSVELARVISVVVALILGLYSIGRVSDYLVVHTRLTENTARVISFVCTVLGAFFAMKLLRWALAKIVKIAFTDTIDRWGGLLAGFVKSAGLVIIVLIVMNIVPNRYLNEQFGEKSVIGRGLRHYMPALLKVAKEGSLPMVQPDRTTEHPRGE